jgi:Icc-related predicted phosphoesterase
VLCYFTKTVKAEPVKTSGDPKRGVDGMFGKGGKRERKFTRVFFVTDVHGSERTFRKFLSSGQYYEADIVMLCGDITGKMLVPIVKHADGTSTSKLFAQDHVLKTEADVQKMEETIANAGYYAYQTDEKTMEDLQRDPAKVDAVFRELMLGRLERWIRDAEQQYRDSGIQCIMTAGNDDIPEADTVLNTSDYVINSEHKVVRLDENHEMITVGEANITPWKCPRDVSEVRLKELIDDLVGKTENVQNAVFNLHAPPKESSLDTAFMLDDSVDPPKIVVKGGQPVTAGVGSAAVREAIEKYKPLLGLHGHIHESRGVINIGRTLCINPGSEYGEGIIRGAIVNLAKDKVLSYQLTSG